MEVKEGVFLHAGNGKVFIQDVHGKVISIPEEHLSPSDKQYVDLQMDFIHKHIRQNQQRILEAKMTLASPGIDRALWLAMAYGMIGIGLLVAGWRLFLQTDDPEYRMAIIAISFSGSCLFFSQSRDEGKELFAVKEKHQTEETRQAVTENQIYR
jgi:hypothetical protein